MLMGRLKVAVTVLGLAGFLGTSAMATAKTAKPAASTTAEKVDLNAASQKELEDLPSVGPATAKKIIAGRPYAKVEDLSKAGVSASTIAKITQLVTAGSAAPAAATEAPVKAASAKEEKSAAAGPVDLNTASEKELEDLSGVGPATAKKIIAGRPYTSVDDLSKAGVRANAIEKIRAQVKVSAAAPAAPVAAAPAATAAPAAAASGANASAKAQVPPSKGMVWVNLNSKVFHREGDQWYGKTKKGKFMTEADAVAAGYREAKAGASKKQ